ncbi:MAG: thiamine diphosphokinase [Rhodobacterales bacterium]|nr:thiamine diphosphokinase [Rhodobacterales bacterium]
MVETIIFNAKAATLVGGGPVATADLDEALAHAPVLVAADGGADRAIAANRLPDWVIGDLDSITPATRARIGARVIHDPSQDTTDFQKCLARLDVPLILGLGFLGGRVDHELATLGAMVAHRGAPIVLIGAYDVIVHVPGAMTLRLEAGMRCSLFPMAQVTGVSKGLDWPIAGLTFAPGGRAGTSNRVTAGSVHLAFDGSGMLLILPRRALGALLAALR